jgi:hypothetical protein
MGRMPIGKDLKAIESFFEDENCFVWIQLSGEKSKISFK